MASIPSGSAAIDLPEQMQWLTDLLSKQQAMFGSFGAFGVLASVDESAPGRRCGADAGAVA